MKRFITIIIFIILSLSCGLSYAQKSDNDYNLRKAYEVLREEKDQDKAIDLLTEQLRATPDNVDALVLRARLNRKKEEFGSALSDINHALRVNKPKKSGMPNSTIYWWKGRIYSDMDEDTKAVECFRTASTLAEKDDPEQWQDIAFDYGCSLFVVDDISASDAVFRKILSRDETDQAAMVGLARNMIHRGEYRDALAMLDKCQKLDGSYAEIYRFKMQAYRALGEEVKAIDSSLDWFERGARNANVDTVVAYLCKRPNYSEAQVKARSRKSETPAAWRYLLCRFYDGTHNPLGVIRVCDELEAEYGRDNTISFYRSDGYKELGLYDKAIEDISRVIENDSYWYYLCARGDYYRLAGMYEEAIADFTAAAEDRPDVSYPYYKRGWCNEMLGHREKALEDYNLGIEIDDDYPYLFLMRGTLLWEKGNRNEAEADFETVVRKDTVVTDGSCRHYALHYLGRDTEAAEWMEKLIALDPDDAGCHYDKACLYARMGDKETAIATLRTAFEKGYRSFSHIQHDDDMDSIREEPEFKVLIEEYRSRHEVFLKENDIALPEAEESVISEIDIKRHSGGTFEIPCNINGLQLQMLFDTGASDVTISSVEANFMLKNGYLSEKDIKGKRYYQIANGELSAGTVITLREVRIGDAVLRNVDASVVKSQKAPLLLGQSAMERFGTITIDNINNKLIIKH